MDEVRVLGYCENCGSEITDEYETYYVNSNGEMLCSIECVCEHYDVTKIEV